MNIFVAKLNARTNADGLRAAFEQFGEVSSSKVIMDHDTGRSKGFGFVEMPNDEEANYAIKQLNESEFESSTIVVKQARPKGAENGGGYDGGDRYKSEKPKNFKRF